MSKNMFEYRIVPGDPTIGDVRNREKFYGYTKCSPLYLNESFRELYNAIISDQSIMSSNNFKVSLVSEKYLKDSITIWENLGIRLQEIDMIIESEAAKEGMFIIDQKFLDGIKLLRTIPNLNKSAIHFASLLSSFSPLIHATHLGFATTTLEI